MFKSDQEPAFLALKQAVRESMPTVEVVMGESLVEEHQSNGTIEVTVREIQKKKTSKSDDECVGRAHEMRSTFETSHSGISRGTRGEIDVAQRMNCMLVSRNADSWLTLENECTSCRFDLEVQDKRNWIPSGKMGHSLASESAVMRC